MTTVVNGRVLMACSQCGGGPMLRTGSCYTCPDCGVGLADDPRPLALRRRVKLRWARRRDRTRRALRIGHDRFMRWAVLPGDYWSIDRDALGEVISVKSSGVSLRVTSGFMIVCHGVETALACSAENVEPWPRDLGGWVRCLG